MPLDHETVRRRVRAAQALGGYESVEKLAEALEGSGVGLKRLRTIWQKGEARGVELREIAQRCELPYEFFTVADLSAALTARENASIDERLERMLSELRAEQIERANLESALQALLGADLQRALAEVRSR